MAIDYTSIDEVVNDFQLMIDDTSYDKEAKIYQLRLLALQGLRELTFDVEQTLKTTEVTVGSTTLQTTLPADFVKMTTIGFKGSDGVINPLGLSDNLTLDSSVTPQAGSDNPADEPYYQTNLGKKFGLGGGNNVNGYYRINRNDNTINFSSELGGKTVYMEYISDGVTSTPAKSHVVRFNMNESNSNTAVEFGIKTGTTIKIPTSGGFTTFSFKDEVETPLADLTVDPLNTDIYLDLKNSTAHDVAEALSTLINEGHPSYSIAPLSKDIRASHIGSTVTVVISNVLSAVPDLMDADFDSNVDFKQYRAAVSQEVVQIGVVGDSPRVHKFCEEALRSYMYYKYIQRKRGVPANEKMMAKKSYFNEKRMARARMMSFSKSEALQTSRKAFKQSPKL